MKRNPRQMEMFPAPYSWRLTVVERDIGRHWVRVCKETLANASVPKEVTWSSSLFLLH